MPELHETVCLVRTRESHGGTSQLLRVNSYCVLPCARLHFNAILQLNSCWPCVRHSSPVRRAGDTVLSAAAGELRRGLQACSTAHHFTAAPESDRWASGDGEVLFEGTLRRHFRRLADTGFLRHFRWSGLSWHGQTFPRDWKSLLSASVAHFEDTSLFRTQRAV